MSNASKVMLGGSLVLLAVVVLSSNTGGLSLLNAIASTDEGAVDKKPQETSYIVTSDTEDGKTCARSYIKVPGGYSTVIVGDKPATIVDVTNGQIEDVFCLNFTGVPIALCDADNKCAEGEFKNGNIVKRDSQS